MPTNLPERKSVVVSNVMDFLALIVALFGIVIMFTAGCVGMLLLLALRILIWVGVFCVFEWLAPSWWTGVVTAFGQPKLEAWVVGTVFGIVMIALRPFGSTRNVQPRDKS